MSERVNILVTVRKAELLPAATLVFRTLRRGFPEAQIFAWGNGLAAGHQEVIEGCVKAVGGVYQALPATSHDIWIEALLQREMKPFWICDTDVVFFHDLESWFGRHPQRPITGRFEPEFLEEWTGTRHMARLHTCVMRLDPVAVRAAMRAWVCRFPKPWRCSAEFPFVRQTFVPRNTGPAAQEVMFYDTCAGLWHSVGGRPFSEGENECFEHLHCGTYVDLMAKPGEPGPGQGLQALHAEVYRDPERARGIRKQQESYYHKFKKEDCLCHTHQG